MGDTGTYVPNFDGENRVDPSVVANLPKGCRVVSTESHGISFWGHTGRINVELEDGTPFSFFMKVVSNERGKNMVHGEYESMKAIHTLLPDFAPKPIAWGTYQDVPDMHYLSIGNLPQMTEWEDSWETFFAKSLKKALDLEIKAKGPDPELDHLLPLLFDKVIPRLLRPLESDGRSVKPSLVHGDLWYANSGIDVETGDSLVFDACSFYAHNEYEFGQWRPICNRFGDEYLAAYHSYVQVSAPEEDYDGRLDLYKLRFNTHVSALFTENNTLREQMLNDIKDLVQRYG
ncbi:hypothetical protein G4B11_000514 [Aspergillus flavus]|nr:hypothetical protein G4B11_000514 [Aspergillus flavus]